MSYDSMVHMAKIPHEQESASAQPEESVYPYNLSLSLTGDELEKLGLDCSDEDCQVGNYLHLEVLAEVTGYHKSETTGGTSHTLNLQITHMQLEDDESEDSEGEVADENEGGEVLRKAGPY